MKNTTNQNQRSYTDLVSTNALLSLLWLVLLTLLFLPTRMVAQTEAPRSASYVAEYDKTSSTLTFKELSSDNQESHIVIANDEPKVSDMCTRLGINTTAIKEIVFEESFKTYAPTSLKEFFSSCSNLKTISGLEYLNTAKVTDMSNMFYGCSYLYSLNLSKFNTENVTNMSNMFFSCQNLPSLDLSNFNTANVKNMACMFYYCEGLSSLNLSKFNTENVTNMSNMFYKCQNLPSLDLSNFNTANVKNMSYMFQYCTKLSSLDLSKFNTANVKNMSYMFQYCTKLSSLDLSNFNTANVTNMASMFYKCVGLSSLDLSNFNTEKVTNMGRMFYECSNLQTIYVSERFVTTNVNSDDKMFFACSVLKGFIDYINNTDKIDHTYANYKTGYFTKLVVRNGDERYGITGETTHLTVDNLTLDDGKDLVVYDPFTATTATYSREMNTGTTWATLCLPFEVSLDGQNFRAFNLLSANEATKTIEMEEIKTSIAAGTPVIIKMKEGATELKFSEANMPIAKEVQTSKTADGNYQLHGIYTQKVFDRTADNNCYIVKGDKLMNPAKLAQNASTIQVGSKPFRAYMVDKTSAPAAGAKMFSIGFDNDGTTAIDSLNTIANDNAIYYDLQGHRLNAPQKGINIVKRGGKTMKVIIK